jgi:biofilm PGA synthesis protein PgaA
MAAGASVLGVPVASATDCVGEELRAAESQYRSGLEDFGAGRLEQSYLELRAAWTSCPGEARFRNDFIAAAADSGHPADAQGAAVGTPVEELPRYVIEALARAARDTQDPARALSLYAHLLAAADVDIGDRVGRDLAWIDAGRAEEAELDLVELRRRSGDRVDVLEALGLADEAEGKVVPALAAAEALLQIDPAHAAGLRLRYRMLVASGAPQLAAELTPEVLVSAADRGRTLQAALALEYRWARDEPGTDRQRAERVDAVILRLQAAADDPSFDVPARTGLRGDLVEALAERGRAAEALVQFQRMLDDGLPIRSYVTTAAVSAYLIHREPQRAVDLYRSLPPDYEPTLGARTNYFYALLESGHYREAVAWADRMAATTPEHLDADWPDLRQANENFGSALVLAALARTYTDRLAPAEHRLDSIRGVAPMNEDALLAGAETDDLRGRPRAALATAALATQLDPDTVGPLAKTYYAELQMADWRAAHATLDRISAIAPADDPLHLREQRDWSTHDEAEFSIEGQIGRSYGGRPGVIDSGVEEYVYSPPIDWNYRVYAHFDQAEGTPVQGDTYRHAAGAGVEYHTAAWLATLELLDIDRGGLAPELSAETMPNDIWRFGVSYALRTLDLPIAASVVGVHADRAAVSIGARPNESREFGLIVSHETFSDGNSRGEALGFWRERWITGPVYKLDTRVDLDTSHDTAIDTNYYNPKSDFTGTVALQNHWLQYRRYDRALSHELDLGIGDYVQQGKGSGAVAMLRYQLTFDVTDRLTLKAGTGRTWRPYDGERERLDVFTFNILGRF